MSTKPDAPKARRSATTPAKPSPPTPAPGPTPAPSPVAPPSPVVPPSPAARGRRFRHRELELAGGGRLVLRINGSIVQLDGDGTPAGEWAPGDPDWAGHAIRFGLFPQDATVAPTGRYVGDMRPPRR